MEAGPITIDGAVVGRIEINLSSDVIEPSVFEGYEPGGRAERGTNSGDGVEGQPSRQHHRIGTPEKSDHRQRQHRHTPDHRPPPPPPDKKHDSHFDSDIPEKKREAPPGKTYSSDGQPPAVRQGSSDTDAAIVRSARAHDLDPNFMRSIANIESGMNPSSNANARTQYKGLYQIGRNEWQRTGQGGNIYSADDNAMAAGRLFSENRRQFRKHFDRDPTESELYMMHQQGLGFYTRGAMTNIQGNPYPGMHGPQTHESFEAGWGRTIAARKAAYARAHPAPVAATKPEAKETPMPEQTEPM